MNDQIDTQKAGALELLSFRVGGQDYAIDIGTTREIRGWSQPDPLPDAPSNILGVLNLRGELLPLLNLANCLGLPTPEIDERSVVVVAEVNESPIGLLVDAVSDIIAPQSDDVQSPPEEAKDKFANVVHSLVVMDKKTIRVLDLPSVMSKSGC